MIKFGVGQPVTRFEDARLLTGRGRYQDDTDLPGQLYAVFLRSPHAHARIGSIDAAGARDAPGVRAVYTGADYAADGLGMPKAAMPRKKGRRLADVRAAAAGVGRRSGALCRRPGGDDHRRDIDAGEGRRRIG
jgi:CO/xanthine dehydrogenase Mo-binding subunit